MLSSHSLFRLSGLGLLAASLISILGRVCDLIDGGKNSSLGVAGSAFLLLGSLLLVICLPALFLRQVPRMGFSGLIGFLLFMFAALLLGIGGETMFLIISPWLASVAPHLAAQGPDSLGLFFLGSGVLELLGGVMFCIATLRAHVFPRWPIVLLLVIIIAQAGLGMAQLNELVSAVFDMLFYMTLAWVSITLLMPGPLETAPQQEPIIRHVGV
ncbi:MAG TPA: hypothetical protein VGN34_07850 [Ktedonobacteraceae bacterium]|jgi:hypothetical protein